MQPTGREFIEAFSLNYQGKRHTDLLSTLDFYFDAHSRNTDTYSLSTSFIQASCTGKSRTMDEIAKIRITLPFNVREKLDPLQSWTYPPPDDEIRDYLCDVPLSDRDIGTARYSAFFKCLFDETLLVLQTFAPTETEPLSLLLYNYLDQNPSHGRSNRQQFFARVVAAAKKATSVAEDGHVTAAQELIGYIKTQKKHAHRSPGSVALVIVFDEAHTLAVVEKAATSAWTRLALVERSLAWLKKLPIFTVSLSTNSKLELLAPSSYHHPSHRASRGFLVPPLTEFYLFDAHTRSVARRLNVDGITLQKMCSPELITSFGRYQWAAMYQTSTYRGEGQEAFRLDRIVQFAKAKLKPRITYGNSPIHKGEEFEYKLACLAIRIMLDIDTTNLWSVPADRETMDTGAPSEPVLVEASAQLLHSDDINMFNILNTALSSNLIAKGERGELAARILFINAQDRVNRHTLDYHSMKYHGPIRLLEFLEQLFTDEAYDYIKNAIPIEAKPGAKPLEDAFKDAWVNFSHFAQARDYGVVKLDILYQFFFRGIMLQCWDNQQTLDFAAPMVFAEGINERLEPENFSLLGVQVKNRKVPAPNVLHMNAFAATSKHPILSILLELGEANAPRNINDDAIVFETQKRVSTRNKDEDKYSLQKQHYQITVHGLEALRLPHRERESLERILDTRKTFESFPRRDRNMDIHKSNLPYYEETGVTLEWWPKKGDTK
ncbi:hypothetical protein EST38_g9615 [Candolleomyces aberdarensis]|uniref:Uncharacterized protein n=1 Tax=Candolleomyces aberdarensis TaxID=2316362 RepID=A0A4Q2DCR6_9AGAR|nr:hypothetical protein EST38_g9615 [Candolleomyces aberdarensis]